MIDEDQARSLLVVGWSQVGKTVLAVQLLLRIQKAMGRLQFRRPPPDLTLVERAKADLSEGRAPGHTPDSTLGDLTLPLRGPVDLVWPDYGGEQVRKMVGESRRLPEGWRERIEEADGWLLLVRPGQSRDFEDILTRPLPDIVADRRQSRIPSETSASSGDDSDVHDPSAVWSDQALLVEILQILREAKGLGAFHPDTAPVLAVVLTCWDELYPGPEADAPTPAALLRERYPLLASFIAANWSEARRAVFGLSAQGQPLSTDPDEAYAKKGPEEHGYVVLPDGSRSEDLTLLIAGAIDLSRP